MRERKVREKKNGDLVVNWYLQDVPDSLSYEVQAYQREHGIKTLRKAVVALVKRGLVNMGYAGGAE